MAPNDGVRGPPICQRYAVINEGHGEGRGAVICGGGTERERSVYLSHLHVIRINIYKTTTAHFLLKYNGELDILLYVFIDLY